MRILRHYRGADPAARGAVVAIGNFDGLHRGHRAVIDEAGRIARAAGAPWAVLTFEPHPRRFFQPQTPPFRLTPFRAKMRGLAALGVDYVFNLRFDARLAGTRAEDFVVDVLVGGFGVGHVVVGPGFAFGRGRRGNAATLRQMAATEGFGFTEIAAVEAGERPVASTDIRALVHRGRVAEAAALLGRAFEVESRVVPGAGRGRGLGFPTANLALDGRLHPGPGIYAVRVSIADGGTAAWHDGAGYIGTRPTFAGDAVLLEAHLFDFDGDLYRRRLRVAFVERVRKDEAFAGPDSLRAQIEADCRRARQILADAAGRRAEPPAA